MAVEQKNGRRHNVITIPLQYIASIGRSRTSFTRQAVAYRLSLARSRKLLSVFGPYMQVLYRAQPKAPRPAKVPRGDESAT